MTILLMLITLFSSFSSPLCSCVERGKLTEMQYESYDAILKGEVVKIQEGELENKIFISVKKVYKGEHTTENVVIETPSRPGFCGLNVGTGDEWLFFALSEDEKLVSDICTRSKNLNPDNHLYRFQKEEIKYDLIFLEETY